MTDPKKFDVIFHWGQLHTWLGFKDEWKKYFSKDTEEVTLPQGASRNFGAYQKAIFGAWGSNPIHAALKQRGWSMQGVRIGVLAFSESCAGAAVLLESPSGGLIDFVYACDGIHGHVDTWKDYAMLAAYGNTRNTNLPPTNRSLVITHSQTPSPGPNIPSTQESAADIAQYVMSSPVPTEFVDIPELKDAPHVPPIKIGCSWGTEKNSYDKVPGLYTTKVGNLTILGYKNFKGTGCTDHIYQSKVIGPRVMKHIIAPRWNNNPRGSGSCVVA